MSQANPKGPVWCTSLQTISRHALQTYLLSKAERKKPKTEKGYLYYSNSTYGDTMMKVKTI